MGKVQYPTADYSDGSFAFGEDVYEDINRIYTEFNGNIDTINLKDLEVGLPEIKDGSVSTGKLANKCVRNAAWSTGQVFDDGVPAWLFTDNYPGSGGGLIMRVLTGTSLSSGDSPKTITYVMNGREGAPTFTEIPTFLGAPIIFRNSGTPTVTAVRVTAKTTRHVSIEYTYTGDGSVVVHFSLAGGI